ncbi:MAG: aminoglycoside phosphotransferase family protein [Anaerolineales bacterium]|nr:aminoglycoside phosphotransferase family protein [Anaerolineales bacterium]
MSDFTQSLTTLVSTLPQSGRVFSNSLSWVLLSNGLTEFDENLIFFGFEEENAKPVLVAKVPRLPKNIYVIQTEYERLTEVWACLGDKAQYHIPQPIALSNVQGQPVLITTYVNGENLLRLDITDNEDEFLQFSIHVANSLRELLDSTLTKLDSDEAIRLEFSQKTEKFKQMYSLQDSEITAVDNLRAEIESNEKIASSKILIHGDFWHGNIIREPIRGDLLLVDWQYSYWTNDASQDVYLFLLAGALATTPSLDKPQERAIKTMQVIKNWNENVIKAYLSAFGLPQNYNLLSMRSGMLMCCVEKGVRASLELGFDREEDLVWFFLFRELLNWFNEK